MSLADNPAMSLDLAVHHEAAHILANARDRRLFHCLRLRRAPDSSGWVGGVKPFGEGETVPDEDDGDHCDDALIGLVPTPIDNPSGVTETVVVNGLRVPKAVAESLQSRVSWDDLAPDLFRYAAGYPGEQLRATQLGLDPRDIVDIMGEAQTSMDRQVAMLFSRRALDWSARAFEEHWRTARDEAMQFLMMPPIWQLFLRLGAELLSKYDGGDEFWTNWWALSQDTRQELVAIGGQTSE